jgi:hypothetical protein
MSRKRTAAELLAWPSQSESDGGFALLGVTAADRNRHAPPATIEELQERLRAKARATRRSRGGLRRCSRAASSDSLAPLCAWRQVWSDERAPRRCAPVLGAQFDAMIKVRVARCTRSYFAHLQC